MLHFSRFFPCLLLKSSIFDYVWWCRTHLGASVVHLTFPWTSSETIDPPERSSKRRIEEDNALFWQCTLHSESSSCDCSSRGHWVCTWGDITLQDNHEGCIRNYADDRIKISGVDWVATENCQASRKKTF
jgi:hypothetical protein